MSSVIYSSCFSFLLELGISIHFPNHVSIYVLTLPSSLYSNFIIQTSILWERLFTRGKTYCCCPVRPYLSVRVPQDGFMWNSILGDLRESTDKFLIWLKSGKIVIHLWRLGLNFCVTHNGPVQGTHSPVTRWPFANISGWPNRMKIYD